MDLKRCRLGLLQLRVSSRLKSLNLKLGCKHKNRIQSFVGETKNSALVLHSQLLLLALDRTLPISQSGHTLDLMDVLPNLFLYDRLDLHHNSLPTSTLSTTRLNLTRLHNLSFHQLGTSQMVAQEEEDMMDKDSLLVGARPAPRDHLALREDLLLDLLDGVVLVLVDLRVDLLDLFKHLHDALPSTNGPPTAT